MWDRAARRLLAAAATKAPWRRPPRRGGSTGAWRRGHAALAAAAGTGAAVAALGPLALRQPLRLEDAPKAPAPAAPAEAPAPPPQRKPQEAAPKAPEAPPARPAARPSAQGTRRAGSVNVDQEMLHLRRIFITGEINDDSAKVVVQQLLYLEAEDPDAPVTIFINSGGGLVHSGIAILDVMSHVSTPLKTVAYGRCFSIAALLLAAGTPGLRLAYSNARLMIHEPSCSYPKLQCSDIMIKVDELRHTQSTLERILSARTGRPEAEIAAAVQRDRYMSVAEAQEFGIIDNVVTAPLLAVPARAGAKGGEAPVAVASALPAATPAPTVPRQPPATPESGAVKKIPATTD